MGKKYQYLVGGFVLLVFSLFQTAFKNFIGSHYVLLFPFTPLSLLLIMTGVFEIKKYYNKYIYLIILFLILIITLILTYLNSTISDLNRIIIGEALIALSIVLLGYDFIHHINESEAKNQYKD